MILILLIIFSSVIATGYTYELAFLLFVYCSIIFFFLIFFNLYTTTKILENARKRMY